MFCSIKQFLNQSNSIIQLYPSIIIRNVFPSTLASHQVAQLIIQQHSSAFFSANILETSIPSDIKSGCLIILPSGQLLLRVDHSTRQRLGLDFPVVSKSKSSKLNSSDHIIAIDLLDPNFTKQSNGNYNGKYRRVQSALGSEHCLEMQLVGCVGKPIFNNEWGLFEARFQRILRDSGSPNATVEFVKSETRFRKVRKIQKWKMNNLNWCRFLMFIVWRWRSEIFNKFIWCI